MHPGSCQSNTLLSQVGALLDEQFRKERQLVAHMSEVRQQTDWSVWGAEESGYKAVMEHLLSAKQDLEGQVVVLQDQLRDKEVECARLSAQGQA